MDEIRRWVLSAPPEAMQVLTSVPVLNFLRCERKIRFNMVGAYDGAMSEPCKKIFQQDYEALDAILRTLTNDLESRRRGIGD